MSNAISKDKLCKKLSTLEIISNFQYKNIIYVIVVFAVLLVLIVFMQNSEIVNPPQPSSFNNSNNTSNAPSGAPPPLALKINMTSLMDDDMKIGSNSAPIIMVEFADFQCPFSRRFWSNYFSQLRKDYIDTGKLQVVYRDFPLGIHPAAEKSAEAVECASEQNKEWEMHDKIFEEQMSIGSTMQYGSSELKAWAAQIGLNNSAFDTCLDSGRYEQEVQKDYDDGITVGVEATPSFIIGKRNGNNIVPLSGALPYGTFKATIDQLLQ